MLDHARLNFLLAFKEIPDYEKAEPSLALPFINF